MTDQELKQIEEFSAEFDTALASFDDKSPIKNKTLTSTLVFDEYEKSVFLTRAQREIFVSLYNGKTVAGEAFETTEELRRYLDTLVKTEYCDVYDSTSLSVNENSVFYKLPDDLAFITLEQVTYGGEDECVSGYNAKVYPVTQDEYARVKDNPFRGPTKYKVLRLDCGNNIVELIHADGYPIDKYLVRYLKKPSPIILVDLSGTNLSIDGQQTQSCGEMNSLLHDMILNYAVSLAVQSKSLKPNIKNNKNE